jgi:hypothetical protein
MNIILTFPRSGSHLLAYILRAKPFTAIQSDGTPISIENLLTRLWIKQSFWFHYPFNLRLAVALNMLNVNKYLLLRDPRDIICSTADSDAEHIEVITGITDYDGVPIMEYPIKERIDILIDVMQPLMHDFEKWRRTGLFMVLRYRDLIHTPEAAAYISHKNKGVVKSHESMMAPEQIYRSTQYYEDLIYYW